MTTLLSRAVLKALFWTFGLVALLPGMLAEDDSDWTFHDDTPISWSDRFAEHTGPSVEGGWR